MKKAENFEEDFNADCELALQVLREKNEELKTDNKALREKVHWWKKEVNVAHRARADEFENIMIENKILKGKLTKAKELLREMIDTPVFCQMGGEAYENELYTELVTKAEQFLSEV